MFRSEFEAHYDDSQHEERQPTVEGEEWSRQTIRTTESRHGKPRKVGNEDEIYPKSVARIKVVGWLILYVIGSCRCGPL